MGRFLLALSFLLVFVAATGFCQWFTDEQEFYQGEYTYEQRWESGLTNKQRWEVEEIVKKAIKDGLQSFYGQPSVPAQKGLPPNPVVSPNIKVPAISRNVLLEPGQSRQSDIVALITSRNKRISYWYVVDVVGIYFDEAKFECINHDIAIAQMLYATDYLNNVQRTAVFNYSGMFNERFCDKVTGIRAHIQHLKGYATVERLRTPQVDPRYDVLINCGYWGTVSTLDDLCRKWAPQSKDYGYRIKAILSEMNCLAYCR